MRPLCRGRTQVRVRYEETDRAGVAYHANYLVWFECARTEMLRAIGVPYRSLEERGWQLTVTEAEARYLRPARYDDLLEIESAVVRFAGARLWIEYRVRGPEGELLCEGGTVLACLDPARGRPQRLPEELIAALERESAAGGTDGRR